MFSVIVVFSSAMVKWKVLLQLMGLMSRSLILVLLKSPDAPDLHSKHWIACCQAGIAATNPCFTQFHLLLNGKSSQLNQWSAPVNNCFSLLFFEIQSRENYIVYRFLWNTCVQIPDLHKCLICVLRARPTGETESLVQKPQYWSDNVLNTNIEAQWPQAHLNLFSPSHHSEEEKCRESTGCSVSRGDIS